MATCGPNEPRKECEGNGIYGPCCPMIIDLFMWFLSSKPSIRTILEGQYQSLSGISVDWPLMKHWKSKNQKYPFEPILGGRGIEISFLFQMMNTLTPWKRGKAGGHQDLFQWNFSGNLLKVYAHTHSYQSRQSGYPKVSSWTDQKGRDKSTISVSIVNVATKGAVVRSTYRDHRTCSSSGYKKDSTITHEMTSKVQLT
jgi:hypothetical protein